jgi:hypothetical protein
MKIANLPTPTIPAISLEVLVAYPNPFQQDFTLEIPENLGKEVVVEMLNAQGVLIETRTLPTGKHIWTPRSALVQGLYLLRITSQYKTQVIRVVKQ